MSAVGMVCRGIGGVIIRMVRMMRMMRVVRVMMMRVMGMVMMMGMVGVVLSDVGNSLSSKALIGGSVARDA